MLSVPLYPYTYDHFETSKAQSTDDECSRDSSGQKSYKTNVCKYKTQMCKNFSQMGYCPYRAKCQFAHGCEELHKSGPTPKKAYRTKKCKSFWEEGVCRYGFRCQFLHYEPGVESQKDFYQAACHLLCHSSQKGKSRLTTILESNRK